MDEYTRFWDFVIFDFIWRWFSHPMSAFCGADVFEIFRKCLSFVNLQKSPKQFHY